VIDVVEYIAILEAEGPTGKLLDLPAGRQGATSDQSVSKVEKSIKTLMIH
jgi:hypothetical protein